MPRYTDRQPSSVYSEVPLPVHSKRRNRLPWLIGGLALLLLIGCGAMGALLTGAGPNNQGLDEPVSTPSLIAGPTGAPKPKPKVAPGADEGGYYVGEDLAPGRYRTSGARKGVITLCYWEVRSDGDPSGAIETVGTVDGVNQTGDVTLKKGQYFKTAGCERWVKR